MTLSLDEVRNVARWRYTTRDARIAIESDAPVVAALAGHWVQAWVFIPHEPLLDTLPTPICVNEPATNSNVSRETLEIAKLDQ